jgi:hypothetical protein
VAEIARVDAASHSFDVKIDLPEQPTWRPGLFGRARFSVGSRSALTVPADALVRRGQLAMVFVVDPEHRVGLRAIRIGDARGDRIEVLAGLSSGDVVVLDPPVTLGDGRVVTPTPRGAVR